MCLRLYVEVSLSSKNGETKAMTHKQGGVMPIGPTHTNYRVLDRNWPIDYVI